MYLQEKQKQVLAGRADEKAQQTITLTVKRLDQYQQVSFLVK